MTPVRKAFNWICLCFCIVGLIIYLWAKISQAGVYTSSLNGNFVLETSPDAKELYYHHIQFKTESRPVWQWKRPNSVTYDHIDLTINVYERIRVLFPSLKCIHNDEQEDFTRTFLSTILTNSSNTGSATVAQENVDELYAFILSVGNGTLPRPRHHSYYIPNVGDYTHFQWDVGLSLDVTGLAAIVFGIILRFFGTFVKEGTQDSESSQRSFSRFTFITASVFFNYASFGLGIYLNSYGGDIDEFGAFLCRVSITAGLLLIPASLIYSLKRRLNPRIAEWDFFGVSLALLFWLSVMTIENI